jgi:hypothetical protein
MIESNLGNLLEENAEALVTTVNCVGIMGKGIALQFKKAYPENFGSCVLSVLNWWENKLKTFAGLLLQLLLPSKRNSSLKLKL